MKISVIGISHHTAPVEVRERFALPGDLPRRLLRAIHAENVLEEALALDTCNRTELYFVPRQERDSLEYILGHVGGLKGAELRAETDGAAFYRHEGAAAVGHLFRVAGALDSQVVGEHQILGQLKDAYRIALEERTAKFFLNKLLHCAFRVGKRVQTETELGRGSINVAQQAVDLAEQIFSDFADKSALLVGAGQTAELAARRLIRRGIRRIVVANRTLERAQQLARDLAAAGTRDLAADPDEEGGRPGQVRCPALQQLFAERGQAAQPDSSPADSPEAEAVELKEIPRVLGEVDLVICSTGSPEPVLRAEELSEKIRRAKRTLFIVDIAVPRDVDPKLAALPNVFLYNMDDLEQVVARNIERRRGEVPRAEAIVADEMEQFVKWCNSRQVAPTIKLLQRRFGMVRQGEIQRYGKKFTSDDRDQLDRFTQSLCNKLIHRPMAFLRQLSEEAPTSDQLAAVDVVRRMFDLDALEDSS